MLPELKWEIALYLDLPEIEIFFPELLVKEKFWDHLFNRDFPNMTGDGKFYRKMPLLSEISKQFGNLVVQMQVLEVLDKNKLVYKALEGVKDMRRKKRTNGTKKQKYLANTEIPIEIKIDEWKNLTNEEYLESTFYFKNGKIFVLPYNIYMIEKLLMSLTEKFYSISKLYNDMGVQWNKDKIERILDGLIENRQFSLLEAVNTSRMYPNDLIVQFSKYESAIEYKQKLRTAKYKFTQSIE